MESSGMMTLFSPHQVGFWGVCGGVLRKVSCTAQAGLELVIPLRYLASQVL